MEFAFPRMPDRKRKREQSNERPDGKPQKQPGPRNTGDNITNYMEQYDAKRHGCPLSFYIQSFYDDKQQTPRDFELKGQILNWIQVNMSKNLQIFI